MQYNDDNTKLSQDEWEKMSAEYEKILQDRVKLADDLILDLYGLLDNLESAMPMLSSLYSFRLSMQNMFSPLEKEKKKKHFFKTPINVLTQDIFSIAKRLLPYSNPNNAQAKNVQSMLTALFDVGKELNEKKHHKW